MNQSPLSRRRLLGIGFGLVGAVALAACSGSPSASAPTTAPAQSSSAPTTAPPANATPAGAANATPTTATSAATSASPTAAPAAAANPSGAGGSIQVATRTGSDAQIMTQTAQTFTKNTGIKTTAVAYGPEPDYWSKVAALFATKQLADVVWASTGNLFGLANRGIFHELDSIIKADNYDLSDYVPNALKSLTLKGQLYAMPWGTHPGNGGLVYSVAALNDAGFTKITDDPTSILDWTYDTLMQAAIKTTKRTGDQVDVYGYFPGNDYLSLTNVIGAFGGDFLNADGTKLTMDTPEFQKGMQWVYDAYVTNKVAPAPTASLNSDQLFDSKKLAMELSGYWGQFQPGIKDDTFKWNDSLQPTGPAGKRGTHLTINGQTIGATTKDQKSAWEFMKFIMSPEQNVQIVLSGGGRPAARKSVLDSPILMQKMKSHKVWVQAIETAEPWRQPANFRWPEFNTTIQQAFADVWVGKQPLDQAIPNATKLLQAVLDKPANS